jgi:lipoate-protein ligase A
MHGEYKVPGGKLVVADLNIVQGLLRGVTISGDFFLEPDTALEAMAAAIEGLPVATSEDEIAQRVQTAVYGAELLGVTPEGVAIAVRRAIEGATQ